MDKIVRFVECLIPISRCNLHCSYCYVIQENKRNTKTNVFQHSPKEIGEAFTPHRWGGLMLVNLCAYGETLLCEELPDIIYYILRQGHYINVTNNGTITKRVEEILCKSEGMLSRLCFAFSLHYVELKKRGLLEKFAENVHKVKDAGCSFLVQLNLADEYIACMDEIKEYCVREFGDYPQVALTRKEGEDFQIFTSYSDKEYFHYGRSFSSPLFDFTYQKFKEKRGEFCYAGDWTFTLDLATGDMKSCYFCKPFYNIYDELDKKIKTFTVGNNCGSKYCINSSHFMSLGVIPEIECPSYIALRDRNNNWYTTEMNEFLSQKLFDNNIEYNSFRKKMKNIRFVWHVNVEKCVFCLKKLKKKGRKKIRRLLH